MEQPKKKRLGTVLLIIALFFAFSFFAVIVMPLFFELEPTGNVALIELRGILRVDSESGFGVATAGSTDIIELIEKADKSPSVRAILIDINSPGGSAVASQEIADAVKNANKTTVALIREVGASGGYWVASAADYSIASKMSITGSIGVIGSYVEFAGLLERYNMTYQRLTAGARKDIGDPFRKLEDFEKDILLEKMDKLHAVFIEEVAANRKIPVERMKEIATGEFYLGMEAVELGLIDAVGNRADAEEWIKKELELETIGFAEYKKETTLLGMLTGVISPQSYLIGKGIGSELKKVETTRSFEILT